MFMFLFSSLLIFACDYILSAASKSSVLLLPALLYLIAIFSFFPFFCSEKKGFLPITFAALTANLFYGVLGQFTAAVGIVDYYIVILQSLCSIIILTVFSLMKTENEKEASS